MSERGIRKSMENKRANHATTCTFQTELNVCNSDEDNTPSLEMTTEELELVQDTNNITLHQACKEGNLDAVKYILSKGLEDINCRDEAGRTPVMEAAKNGHVAVFDYLVSQGCDLSATTYYGYNILHLACCNGHGDIVRKLLVNAKYDIDSRDGYDRTPIMLAVICDRREIVKLLVSKGCNLTLVDVYENNILHQASLAGRVDMIQYILSKNMFGTESRGDVGRTPLMIAAGSGHKDAFDLLVAKGCNLTTNDYKNSNILHLACTGNNRDIVKWILDHEIVDIDSRGDLGRTPLLAAAEKGHVELVEFLLTKTANFTAIDDEKNNILHVACIGGHVNMVQLILSKSIASIEDRGFEGMTPVMIAAWKGKTGVFDFLVGRHCKLTVVDDQKNNIFHVACMGGRADIVKHLMTLRAVKGLEKGENKYGDTPVQVAGARNFVEVISLLKAKNISEDYTAEVSGE